MATDKSPRNRTLTLSDTERESLAKLLLLPADLTGELPLDRTINGDLFDAIDHLPEAFAELIVVDPPYNLSKDFDALAFRRTDTESYRHYTRRWLEKVVRCLKPTGTIYVCCDWRCSSEIYDELSRLLTVKNRITWQREKGRGSKTNWKNSMEDIWMAVADDRHYYFDIESVKQRRRVVAPYRVEGRPKDWEETPEGNFRLTHPSNFWDDISVPYWSMPENTEHPTQKPEKLIAKLILASSRPGDVVFDPFLGSGTTSVVAKKLNRHYLGIEQSHEYCLLAEKRLKIADTDTHIQGYDGTFWERNSAPKR